MFHRSVKEYDLEGDNDYFYCMIAIGVGFGLYSYWTHK